MAGQAGSLAASSPTSNVPLTLLILLRVDGRNADRVDSPGRQSESGQHVPDERAAAQEGRDTPSLATTPGAPDGRASASTTTGTDDRTV